MEDITPNMDDKKEEPKKKRRFNLFDVFYTRNRSEDSVDDIDETRGIKNYFLILYRAFGRIFTINIYSVLGNFPIFFILLALSENLHLQTTEPASPLFGPIYGALSLGTSSPSMLALFGSVGMQENVSLWTPAAYGFMIAGLVLLLITFGPITAGTTYNMRNIVKREPVFMWDDFKYAIKKNLKQSILLGAIDLIILFTLGYNIFFYYLNIGRYVFNVLFIASIVMLVMYSYMRNYMYLLLVTFDLTIGKIFKNALIFSVMGFGRNTLALIANGLIIILNLAIAIAYLPIGIILPFIITVGLCLYTTVYTAWPKIYKIMIEPYVNKNAG